MLKNIGDSMDNKRKLEADPIEAIFELNMGDFLTEYLISDDLLDKTLLECGYWTMRTNSKAAWAYTNCVNFDGIKFLYKPDLIKACAVLRA